jgi:hypothetical protein
LQRNHLDDFQLIDDEIDQIALSFNLPVQRQESAGMAMSPGG